MIALATARLFIELNGRPENEVTMKDRIEFVASVRRVSGSGFPMTHIDLDPKSLADKDRGYGAVSVPITADLRPWITGMMVEWLEETSRSSA